MPNRMPFQILLVEDSPTSAELARCWLRDGLKTPFRLLSAACLASAIEILRRGVVDLTILDLNLPDSRGFDTLREHQQRTATKILEAVFGAVRDFADGLAQNDDETLGIEKVVP